MGGYCSFPCDSVQEGRARLPPSRSGASPSTPGNPLISRHPSLTERVMSRLPLSALVLSLGMALLVGCTARPTGAALDTLVKVSYADAIERENVDYEEYTGRTVAVKTVDVRPQVTATVEQVLFKDGDTVQKEQALYLLDA